MGGHCAAVIPGIYPNLILKLSTASLRSDPTTPSPFLPRQRINLPDPKWPLPGLNITIYRSRVLVPAVDMESQHLIPRLVHASQYRFYGEGNKKRINAESTKQRV